MAPACQASASHRILTRLSVCTLLMLPLFAEADPFLGPKAANLNSDSELLLEELTHVLGEKHRAIVEERVVRLTLALLPTFQALPRTAEDRLRAAGVRYLLHRYFVDRHGWYVRGLDTVGDSWNSSSPSSMLGNHVDKAARDIFEERLSSRGLSLHEIAVLAATLEGLVHSETVDRLEAAFRFAGIDSTGSKGVKEDDVLHAIDFYMLMYVKNLDHTKMTQWQVATHMLSINEVYPNWGSLQKWVRKVRSEVLSFSSLPSRSFATEARVLEEIGSRYGHWQNQECLNIKDMLLKLEQPGTGRVPLASFYGAALTGTWQFAESKSYLRQMGALDEGDLLQPSIVIPNYVNAPSNCVASSAFYSVCCISECEALLGHLEKTISATDATPSRIITTVEGLPSATVHAPRRLSAPLQQRLKEIGLQHGGQVPLHGRLFMQWLHHAYPNECSFPHLSGSSKPVTMATYVRESGQNPTASPAAMRQYINETGTAIHPLHIQDLPWLADEELFVRVPDTSMTLEDVAHGVILVAIVVGVSMAVTLLRSLARARTALKARPPCKLSV